MAKRHYAWAICFGLLATPASADHLASLLVENGRYEANSFIQVPYGWRMSPATNGFILVGQQGCGIQMSTLQYQPVSGVTLQTSFNINWGQQLNTPGTQIIQQYPGSYQTNAQGTMLMMADAVVSQYGLPQHWTFFMAEGNSGGRMTGLYSCNNLNADAMAHQQAVAALTSLAITLTPRGGPPPIASGNSGAIANAQKGLETQRSITQMQQDLFNSHQSFMRSQRW